MSIRAVILSVVVLSGVSIDPWVLAAMWYVDGRAQFPGDGTTWETAFETIQEAINAAASGDEIEVAEGTYVENINFDGKDIVLRSTDPTNPAVVENTIIDGNQAGPVVTFSGREHKTCVLSGFTIRNGACARGGGIAGNNTWATIKENVITGNSAVYYGGGLAHCEGTIEDNTISENSARNYGGGLYRCGGLIQKNVITANSADYGAGLSYCGGIIQNNVISENSAGNVGGGLYECDGTIGNNTISANSADYNGGGLYGCGGMIRNNTISTNSADNNGGGLNACDAAIGDNTISDNSAGALGGGLCACGGVIQNNTISDNSAGDDGGGLCHCRGMIENNGMTANMAGDDGGGLCLCDGTIQKNIITANLASDSGGGLYRCGGTVRSNRITENWCNGSGGGLADCDGLVENNTVCGNTALFHGGGLWRCDGTIINCIVCRNTAIVEGPQAHESATPGYSCIQDWTGGGERNTGRDPQFVDRDGPDDDPETYEDNDYRLAAGSPCIDSGKNDNWMWDAVDLDANPRIYPGARFSRVDAGAYEYIGPFSFKAFIGAEPPGSCLICWSSLPGHTYSVRSCADLLAGAWNEEATIPSQGLRTFWTDSTPRGRIKFYRVEVDPGPGG